MKQVQSQTLKLRQRQSPDLKLEPQKTSAPSKSFDACIQAMTSRTGPRVLSGMTSSMPFTQDGLGFVVRHNGGSIWAFEPSRTSPWFGTGHILAAVPAFLVDDPTFLLGGVRRHLRLRGYMVIFFEILLNAFEPRSFWTLFGYHF